MSIPKSIAPMKWNSTPPADRDEALSRTAWILRYEKVTPDVAFDRAISTMKDEQDSSERPFTWETISKIRHHWPHPHRYNNGTIREDIIHFASVIDSIIDSSIEHLYSKDEIKNILLSFTNENGLITDSLSYLESKLKI